VLLTAAGIIIGIYVLFGIFLSILQSSMVYVPDDDKFGECEALIDAETIEFQGTRLYYTNNTEDLVIAYHSNTGSACDMPELIQLFKDLNVSYIFVEYNGYGVDGNIPSKDSILADVQNTIEFVENIEHHSVHVVGYSLGSALAAHHASHHYVDSMTLISPFTSIADIAKIKYWMYPVDIILSENYANTDCVREYEGRLLLIHSTSDHKVPFRMSEELYAMSPSADKELISMDNVEHGDMLKDNRTTESIKEFLSE